MLLVKAGKEVVKARYFKVLFAAMFLLMWLLFILIPVLTVPLNDFKLQLSVFTAKDYAMLTILAGLNALFITMQVYIFKQTKKASALGVSGASGAGALFAGIAGTAFCASCVAPLLGIIGIGFSGVVFVLEYRLYIMLGVIGLMLLSIYLSSKKIVGICNKNK